MNSGILFIYTVGFVVYGVMEVLGLMPQELISFGMTLPGIFGKFYGEPVGS